MSSNKENTAGKHLLVISKYLPEYTGAAYRIHNLYKRLGEKNPDINVEVLCTSTSEKNSKRYNYEGFNVKRIVFPWSLSWLPSRASNAVKVYYEAFWSFLYLCRLKPEFLHIAGYSGATMAALLYGRIKRLPRLVELVTKDATPFQYLPCLRYGGFLDLRHKTIIVAISDAIAEKARERGLGKNIWCRANPIDEKRFSPVVTNAEKQKLRDEISGFGADEIVIAMVAKFMPQKNQIFLLDVMKELPKHYKLLLAGPLVNSGMFLKRDQGYFADIQNKIKEYGLQDRVSVSAGFVDSAQYIKACDIYVMPQYSEGLGTPMLEAISCGVPVVANQSEPAFCEWIKNGENGYLSDMVAKEFAEKIQLCADIPEKVLKASANEILSNNSNEKLDAQYIKIFEALKSAKYNQELDIKDVI